MKETMKEGRKVVNGVEEVKEGSKVPVGRKKKRGVGRKEARYP